MVKDFAHKPGSGLRSLAMIGGTLATIAAAAVGAVLAVFFAASMVVIALMASALLALVGLALRARRAAKVLSDGLIEARHLGGHHWVAYGWNERR